MFDAPPDKPALIMGGTGSVVTHGELESRSRRLAQLLHARGLRPGDHLAVLLENEPTYYEVFWAAQRSGLHLTPINWHLRADEAGYIVEDCGASALVTSVSLASVLGEMAPYLGAVSTRLVVGGDLDGADLDGGEPDGAGLDGWERYEDAVADQPDEPLDEELEGAWMFYSSGTTGRPKGIKGPLSGEPFGAAPPPLAMMMQLLWGFTDEATYLCPAPLYHAAPLGWSTSVQRLGGTVVLMERFEPVDALRLIERHRVTHAQLVPTHFVRMLKLDESERAAHDVSSLQVAVHAAAPCPVAVKEQMLDWWGPIIHEYYAGSEGNGLCAIGPEEWRERPGSVGKSLGGPVHIVDEDGSELAPGETGQIWFESGVEFEYHNDAEKTRAAFDERRWSSLGDVGHLDDEGYLYLTDRISHMIISGGVNIYPQEVEDLLAMHPAVADVAVIGVPDPDMGEQVKAVVQPADPSAAGSALADELIATCRGALAVYKCPRSVDFVDELPRLPTGKLLKRELRLRYWPEG